MPIRITLVAGCIAALLPLSVTAAPPASAGCQIELPGFPLDDPVAVGVPYTIVVSRDPGYPGQWFAPTISVDMEVPVNVGDSYTQTVTQSAVGLGGSNDASVTFYVPYLANRLPGETVRLFASVSEPLNRKKQVVVATCEATTTLN